MTLTDAAPPTAAEAAHTKGRTVRLAVILLAQLLIVLDATVVNVALPDAQKALHMSDADRQWVVTLYALTFGSLLLLGGRIADFWGRRRTFLVGMAGFAAASALGGLAQGGSELFAARAGQGVFAAMLAPAALSLIQVNFPTGPARAKAFGLYGAIGGGGAALGLVLGGVLTEYLSWRWCLLVNVPVAIVAVVSGRLVLKESRAPGEPAYDVPGAALVTVGLASLVYGLNRASVNGWQSGGTFAFLALAVVLLVGFVLVEQRSAAPLLPMRIPVHPTRGGAYLAALIGGAALDLTRFRGHRLVDRSQLGTAVSNSSMVIGWSHSGHWPPVPMRRQGRLQSSHHWTPA
jgi:MFS family permease